MQSAVTLPRAYTEQQRGSVVSVQHGDMPRQAHEIGPVPQPFGMQLYCSPPVMFRKQICPNWQTYGPQ
jgi:hypothetical protein